MAIKQPTRSLPSAAILLLPLLCIQARHEFPEDPETSKLHLYLTARAHFPVEGFLKDFPRH